MQERRLSCRQVRRASQAYLDGELEHTPAELVASHLAACARCGVEADTMKRVIQRIRAQRPELDRDGFIGTHDTLDDLLRGS